MTEEEVRRIVRDVLALDREVAIRRSKALHHFTQRYTTAPAVEQPRRKWTVLSFLFPLRRHPT